MRKKFTLVASLAFAAALCAGVASATVTADAAETKSGFAITATAVRTVDPAGLRFKVDCPEAKANVTNAYTVITLTPVGGEQVTATVEATVWRTDGSGWNTVLLDIPASDYATEVTAQAFMTVDGVEYETAAQTSTIAKTASLVMAENNEIDATLNAYVTNVESITLDAATATVQDGQSLQLTATIAPADYGVVWASDDETVATVDNTGKVTGVKAGTANITATMGNKTATCTVNVKGFYEDFENVTVDDIDYLYWGAAATTNWKKVDTAAAVTGLGAGDTVAVPKNTSKMAVLWSGATDTRYFTLSKDFLDGIFADTNVTALVFDVAFYSARTAVRNAYISYRQTTREQIDMTYQNISTVVLDRTNYEAWLTTNKGGFNFTITTLNNGVADNAPIYIYIDNMRTVETAFDPTFETMSLAMLSYAIPYGSLAGIEVMQLPDGSGRAVKAVAKGTNDPYLQINFSDEFVAQAAVGKTLSYSVWAVKGANDKSMYVKAKPSAGIAQTNGGFMTGDQVLARAAEETTAWVEVSVTLTQAMVNSLQSEKCLTFILKSDASTKTGTYYIDNIVIR